MVKNLKSSQNRINFNFVSYLPLASIIKFNFFNNLSKKNKLLLKHSYLFLTWFFYLSRIKTKNKLSIITFPTKTTVFTLTKAPMAHRKNSKEQYKLQYFNFHVSFELSNMCNTPNETLYACLFYKKNFMFFETNLFFIKNFSILLTFKPHHFINFFKFSQNLSL